MGKLKDKIKKELDRDVRRVKVEVYHDIKYAKTHIPKMITSAIVLVFFIILFVLFRTKQGDQFKQSTENMVVLANTNDYIIKPTKVKDILQTNLKDYQVIDIRSTKDYKIYKIDSTMHIPFEQILKVEHKSLWKNDIKKIIISTNEIEATQAWLILTELGYTNMFVLEGGMSFWKKNMNSIFKPPTIHNNEKAKYNYAQVMKDLKGNDTNTSTVKKVVKKKIKRTKKSAGGGCG